MRKNNLSTGLLITIIGLLFIILKGDIISIASTCLGVILIINGIIDITKNNFPKGITAIIVGVIIIVFGWVFLTVALYLFGIILILYGINDLYNKLKVKINFDNVFKKVIYYVIPLLYLIAGISLLFNQGEAISFVFVLTGIILFVNGILITVEASKL